MPDYSKGLIYTIKSCDDLYVGSTTNFTKRKYQHKSAIKEGASKLYQKIRDNECRWDMKPYKEFPCENKIQLEIEEERVRCELNANLNSFSCSGKDMVNYKQYQQQYHKQYQKQEKYKEKSKIKGEKWREQNNTKEKVICECGCSVCRGFLTEHKKTKKHQKLIV